jgi:hypothetical protein
MADKVGFEPTTGELTALCSTVELLVNKSLFNMERVGLKPTANWLKANCSTSELPFRKVVGRVGFEPTTNRFTFVFVTKLRGLYLQLLELLDANSGY